VSSADGGAAAPGQLRGARPATGSRYNTFIDWLDSCHHRASGHVVQYGTEWREWWDGHWIHDRILSKLEPGK
jgi:hypothetical protein